MNKFGKLKEIVPQTNTLFFFFVSMLKTELQDLAMTVFQLWGTV